jgi:hypothetical protein
MIAPRGLNMKNPINKRKRCSLRITLLSICLCLFATTAFAEEMVMTCSLYTGGKTETRHLKYSDPIFGEKQIYNRVDGEWQEWCRSSTAAYNPCELTITNRGAIQTVVYEGTASKDVPEDNMVQGTAILVHIKYILDFEFITRSVETYYTTMNGRSITGGGSTDEPFIDVWDCKLN